MCIFPASDGGLLKLGDAGLSYKNYGKENGNYCIAIYENYQVSAKQSSCLEITANAIEARAWQSVVLCPRNFTDFRPVDEHDHTLIQQSCSKEQSMLDTKP